MYAVNASSSTLLRPPSPFRQSNVVARWTRRSSSEPFHAYGAVTLHATRQHDRTTGPVGRRPHERVVAAVRVTARARASVAARFGHRRPNERGDARARSIRAAGARGWAPWRCARRELAADPCRRRALRRRTRGRRARGRTATTRPRGFSPCRRRCRLARAATDHRHALGARRARGERVVRDDLVDAVARHEQRLATPASTAAARGSRHSAPLDSLGSTSPHATAVAGALERRCEIGLPVARRSRRRRPPLSGSCRCRIPARAGSHRRCRRVPAVRGCGLPAPSTSRGRSPGTTAGRRLELRELSVSSSAPPGRSFASCGDLLPEVALLRSLSGSRLAERNGRYRLVDATSTRLACAPTAWDTYANFPSSETTTARGSRGSDTSNVLTFAAFEAASARPQPLVTRSVASFGRAPEPRARAPFHGAAQLELLGLVTRLHHGHLRPVAQEDARRPSGKNMSLRGASVERRRRRAPSCIDVDDVHRRSSSLRRVGQRPAVPRGEADPSIPPEPPWGASSQDGCDPLQPDATRTTAPGTAGGRSPARLPRRRRMRWPPRRASREPKLAKTTCLIAHTSFLRFPRPPGPSRGYRRNAAEPETRPGVGRSLTVSKSFKAKRATPGAPRTSSRPGLA